MLIWVTSFTQPIYTASGRNLIKTFVQNKIEGQLYAHSEGAIKPRPPGMGEYASNVHWKDGLQTDPQLTSWLEANADIIPTDLGGKWKGPCKCPNGKNPHAKTHKLPCPGYWFCRHASRWYRKMVALRRTLDDIKPSHYPDLRLLWVDADVIFRSNKLTEERVDCWFQGHDLFYLKGPKRAEWETGVFGIKGVAGVDYLRKLFLRFSTGKFREDIRWDDCYQSRMTLKSIPTLKAIDLATDASGYSEVVPHSPLGEYMAHLKGVHSRILKIFK